MMQLRKFLWLGCAILLVAGCEQIAADKAKAVDEVLNADASFKDLLSKKERLNSEIARAKASYEEGKAKLLNEISQLRAKLSIKNKEFSSKMQNLKAELEPERQVLKAKVAELRVVLNAREKALSHIKAIERNASSLAEANDPALKKKLNVEGVTKGFSSQSQALAAEVSELKERLRILLLKERLLRQ